MNFYMKEIDKLLDTLFNQAFKNQQNLILDYQTKQSLNYQNYIKMQNAYRTEFPKKSNSYIVKSIKKTSKTSKQSALQEKKLKTAAQFFKLSNKNPMLKTQGLQPKNPRPKIIRPKSSYQKRSRIMKKKSSNILLQQKPLKKAEGFNLYINEPQMARLRKKLHIQKEKVSRYEQQMVKNGYNTQEVSYIRRYKNFRIEENDLFWHLKFIKKIWRNKQPVDFLKTLMHRNRHISKSMTKWIDKNKKIEQLKDTLAPSPLPQPLESEEDDEHSHKNILFEEEVHRMKASNSKQFKHSHRQLSFSNEFEEEKIEESVPTHPKIFIPVNEQIKKMKNKSQNVIHTNLFLQGKTPNQILRQLSKPPKSPKLKHVKKNKPKTEIKLTRMKSQTRPEIQIQETSRTKRKKKKVYQRTGQTPHRSKKKDVIEMPAQQFERYQYSPSPRQTKQYVSNNMKRRTSNLRNSNYIPRNLDNLQATQMIKLNKNALKKKHKIYQTVLQLVHNPPKISSKRKRCKTPNNRFDYIKDKKKRLKMMKIKKVAEKKQHRKKPSQSFQVKEIEGPNNQHISIVKYSFASPRIQNQEKQKKKKSLAPQKSDKQKNKNLKINLIKKHTQKRKYKHKRKKVGQKTAK